MLKRLVFILVLLLGFISIGYSINIAACSNLNTMGGLYNLTADITNATSLACMNLSANNVTLDCQNHIIDGDGGVLSYYGIYLSRGSAQSTNVTIQNCIIKDFPTGLQISNSKNNLIKNITTYNNTWGISISTSSNSNNFFNISSYNNNQYGIYILTSILNNFSNLVLYNNLFDGIYDAGSSNNNSLTNVISYNNSHNGIYVSSGNYWILNNISCYNNSS